MPCHWQRWRPSPGGPQGHQCAHQWPSEPAADCSGCAQPSRAALMCRPWKQKLLHINAIPSNRLFCIRGCMHQQRTPWQKAFLPGGVHEGDLPALTSATASRRESPMAAKAEARRSARSYRASRCRASSSAIPFSSCRQPHKARSEASRRNDHIIFNRVPQPPSL